MKGIQKIVASKYWWLLLLVVLFGINYIASVFHARFDLTKEKRYTLSKATKDLLKKLDDDVQIDVFLKGEFPAGFKKLANSTGDFLQLLKDGNGAKIHYRFISPLDKMPETEIIYGDSLTAMGAIPINLTAQKKAGKSSNIIFPVAVITYKQRQELVNLYAGAGSRITQEEINSAEALMEYQFARTLDKLTETTKPGIAYSIGNGEPTDARVYDLSQTLSRDYDFKMLDLKSQPDIPDAVDILLIVKPTEQYTEEEKLKIDQFVMHGGKLLCFIDNLIAEQDSLSFKPETIAYDRNLNLTDLFFRYGLRINTDLVMDLQCDLIPFVVGGTPDNPQIELLHWNYFPLLNPANNRLSKNMGYISSHFANSIDTIQVKNVNKSPLLVSSPNSRLISTPALISLNENKTVPEDEQFKRNAIPVAMLLEGKFTSLYKNRTTQSQRDTLAAYGTIFSNESPDNKMIVVADGDIVFNEFLPAEEAGQQPLPLPMGWNKYTYREYTKQTENGKLFVPAANREFLLNCVEYLVNNPAIAETRNKEIVLRLLDSKKIKEQKPAWQFISIVVPIIAVLLFAIFYQQIRKRTYAL
ncbi:MAG TPA: gliding motility-associated ABC transporter substrate-binding protein GldG [Chitinophagaceae bacterium]|nr:gliding motility-associated ABC transporter substrate-binding protein GldG [Chitinophagaceae bacterium]